MHTHTHFKLAIGIDLPFQVAPSKRTSEVLQVQFVQTASFGAGGASCCEVSLPKRGGLFLLRWAKTSRQDP